MNTFSYSHVIRHVIHFFSGTRKGSTLACFLSSSFFAKGDGEVLHQVKPGYSCNKSPASLFELLSTFKDTDNSPR